MNQLKVNLWGKEFGHLVWNSETRTANFVYNSDLQDIPNVAPILSPVNKRSFDILIYGDERPLYQGLPPFIADSLPDSWGNSIIDLWFKTNKTSSRNSVNRYAKIIILNESQKYSDFCT